MWSPVSTCGVKDALCLPLRRMAICVHRRPSTLSVASTTYQSARTFWLFAKTVEATLDITKTPTTGRAHSSTTKELGGELAEGPLEKGAQVYSSPPSIAKLFAP